MRNGNRHNVHRSDGHGHGGSHPSVEILSQMGYETRDVSLPGLARWLGVLLMFIVGSTVGMRIMYSLILPTYADERNQPMLHERRVPPFPQVQAEPKHDMMAYRSAEDRVLDGQAAMPGEQPGMSVDAAMDTLADQKGIAGVTGHAVPAPDPNSDSYPGGGDYGKGATPTAAAPSPVAAPMAPGMKMPDGSTMPATDGAATASSPAAVSATPPAVVTTPAATPAAPSPTGKSTPSPAVGTTAPPAAAPAARTTP